MAQPINVSIANQSTLFKDADLPALANALQIQVQRDFFPNWGVMAQLYYTPAAAHPPADHWVLAILDNSDQAGALGEHDVTPTGLPLGKAFVATTQAAGDQVSVTVSHELLEMLADPYVNLSAQNGAQFFAWEVCDAVEDDSLGYQIVIPAGWPGAGTSILVSDFVLPRWFEASVATGPFAFKTKLTAPLQLGVGGYIGMLDLNDLSAGWQQVTARNSTADPKAALKARPHLGSRRALRSIRSNDRIRSTYVPGNAAIAAKLSS